MKNSPAFVTLCVVLAASALLNVMLLMRAKESAVPRPGPAAAGPERLAASEEPKSGSTVPIARADFAIETDPGPAAALAGTRPPAAPPPPRYGIKFDPSVEAVIDAQEKFGAFWRDLDRVFRAKDRLEESRYFQAVVGATQDFLELYEPVRAQFAVATQTGIAELVRARKDKDAARALLGPKDKTNPTAAAAYERQKDEIDAQYDQRVAAAVAGVTALLDRSRPRHSEFSASADRWLKNLVPKVNP